MISISDTQLAAWISPLLWPFLRILAVFTAAPVFSSRAFPMRGKIALAFLIALASQASLPPMPVIALDGAAAMGAVVQQVGVGLAIGFAVRLVFSALELAGEVIGFQMGLNFAAFFDPMTNAQSSATARFYGQMAALLFLALNAHLWLILAVTQSFQAFPVDQNFLVAVQTMGLHRLGAELFASALWIALPLLGIMLFVNLALGIVSRIAPQMNIFAVGFPVTLAVGMLGIAATLPLLDRPYSALLEKVVGIFHGA